MREELHDRLEGMVLDVQELIESQENPENSPANAESDELYDMDSSLHFSWVSG